MQRSRAETSKRALARIQRLCCLGVGSEVLVPVLLREVAGLLPSKNGRFCWAGPNLEVVNYYGRFTAISELYFQEFCGTFRENSLMRGFKKILTSPLSNPVQPFWPHLQVDLPTFLRSELYNIIFRAANIYEPLTMCVREAGRYHGVFYFYRAERELPFQPDDFKMLEMIAGFVTHGMTRPALHEDAFIDGDDRALFVASLDGSVRHAAPQARRLLVMALNPHCSPAAKWRGLHEPEPAIARLCCALASTANGEIGHPPPVLRLRNPWGEFVLRAYWLGPTDGAEQTREIGITIERRVPRALAVLRRVEELPLSAREKQYCLLLARDSSGRDIADRMGLAASTVIAHQRSIYAKLAVHSRAGLLAELQPA
jgi:DNA-binding CsgD family transcriptional regulator